MVNGRNFSDWAKEVDLVELHHEKDFYDEILENAYEAINKFCRKEQKRSKIAQRKRHCWN